MAPYFLSHKYDSARLVEPDGGQSVYEGSNPQRLRINPWLTLRHAEPEKPWAGQIIRQSSAKNTGTVLRNLGGQFPEALLTGK